MNKDFDDIRELSQKMLLFQSIYKDNAKKVGLTDTLITVLYVLSQHPKECTQKSLIEHTYLPKQTIHFVIEKLIDKKLVILTSSPSDKRVKIINLTEKGEKYIQKKIFPFVNSANNAFLKMSDADQKKLVELFTQYLANLQNELN